MRQGVSATARAMPEDLQEAAMIPRYTRPEMAADLGPRDALSHLVRDRGACGLRHGRARPDPQGAPPRPSGRRAPRPSSTSPASTRSSARSSTTSSPSSRTWPSTSGPRRASCTPGLTSSDILDTCFNVQLVRAADLLLADLDALLAALEEARARAQAHAHRRPQPRHPRRAHHLRPQARLGLRRVRARQGAPDAARAPRSPPAPSPARSAPSPTSIRASRPTSPTRWA